MQCAASSRSAFHDAVRFERGIGSWLLEVSIIAASRFCAPASKSPMSAVSGRFFQYFLGISLVIAFTLTRAGLKMLA